MQNVSTTETKLIWYGITLTYVFYFTGTLYVVGSVIGWAIFALFLLRAFVEGKFPKTAALPISVSVWLIGMATMLIALLVAHADFQLGTAQTVKSSIGWAKGWALLALFPLLGSVLNINTQLISRACCILTAQTFLFVILSIMAFLVGFDGPLYLSPLKAIGGPISTFEVNLFGMNPETGKPRWPFFAPWAPAAGLMSCIYLVICSQEQDKFWRRLGMTGAFLMCVFCQSRAGWAIFLGLIPTLMIYRKVNTPTSLLIAAMVSSTIILVGQPVIEHVLDIHQQIKDARPDSTRVRNDLANIALQRWESEAPVWGHGIVEAGPKIVEFMPIGSHHSWYGLLFVKGIVGLFALAVPMLLTFIHLGLIATKQKQAWISLLIMLVLLSYSFFENLEILAYLLWPALLWVGISLNPLKETGVRYE